MHGNNFRLINSGILKSDHIGIEMLCSSIRERCWNELKSDHIGIEISFTIQPAEGVE